MGKVIITRPILTEAERAERWEKVNEVANRIVEKLRKEQEIKKAF